MSPAPSLHVRIAEDHLAASLEPGPPVEAAPSLEELVAMLTEAGVVHGIDYELLEHLLAEIAEGDAPKAPVEVAHGTPPSPGLDGSFVFLPGAAAGEGAQGAIDFHERRRFTRVARGERIAIWKTAVHGTPGKGVDGLELEPPPVHEVPFARGENVELVPGPEGTEVIANLDGVASVGSGNRVAVLDLLRIDGDVDYSVGNIETTGMVLITGSVRSSFTVRAGRGITIGGTIEDAIVETDGDLKVGRGILGGDFGHVKAGGKLELHHAQNARIECAGDVVFGDSDLGSTIRCGGRLQAVDCHGRLGGGRYEAVGGILVRELGSTLGVPTRVRVGANGVLEDRIADLEAQLAVLDGYDAEDAAIYEGHEPLTREHAAEMRKRIVQRFELRAALATLRAERAEFDARFVEPVSPTITVLKTIYSGVRLAIRSGRAEVHETLGPECYSYDAATGALLAQAPGGSASS